MLGTILIYTLIGLYLFLGLYLNYMTIRDDIRKERERKEKLKKGDGHDHH